MDHFKKLRKKNKFLKEKIEELEFEIFLYIIFFVLLLIIFSVFFHYIWYMAAMEKIYCYNKEYCLFSFPYF